MTNYTWRVWYVWKQQHRPKLDKQDIPGKHPLLQTQCYFLRKHIRKYSSFDREEAARSSEQKNKKPDREAEKDRWVGKWADEANKKQQKQYLEIHSSQ